ncbi:MAG TPA: RDD family protein [Granulicella sp.]|nr:RDD family protein [Granulicella sp.]
MRSAEFQLVSSDSASAESGHDVDNLLRQQVAERLAAHRSRRDRTAAPAPTAPERSTSGRANQIAATVAERYSRSQSYRDFLAAEAQRAIDEANAAAEIAARNAIAISIAQQQLIEELEQARAQQHQEQPQLTLLAASLPELESHAQLRTQEHRPSLELVPEPPPAFELSLVPPPSRARRQTADSSPSAATPAPPDASLTVRLYGELGRATSSVPASVLSSRPSFSPDPLDEDEHLALDEEIEFRQTPGFEEPASPPEPLPANLIEFPRQLIAARKARPRYAEGPLREEAEGLPDAAQLRIFEVEAAQIASTPVVEDAAPEWSSICLETPRTQTAIVDETPFALPPQAAPLNLRLMSAAVDASILAAGLFSFVAVAAFTAGRLPTGPTAAISAGGSFLLLFLLYRALFFTLADATPGMRYARIALCTFSDENPSRSAMRRRTWALLLSACPLGIGFLWACLDDDRLGWHDRISRMYQRSY